MLRDYARQLSYLASWSTAALPSRRRAGVALYSALGKPPFNLNVCKPSPARQGQPQKGHRSRRLIGPLGPPPRSGGAPYGANQAPPCLERKTISAANLKLIAAVADEPLAYNPGRDSKERGGERPLFSRWERGFSRGEPSKGSPLERSFCLLFLAAEKVGPPRVAGLPSADMPRNLATATEPPRVTAINS